jgi:hypothetical protein
MTRNLYFVFSVLHSFIFRLSRRAVGRSSFFFRISLFPLSDEADREFHVESFCNLNQRRQLKVFFGAEEIGYGRFVKFLLPTKLLHSRKGSEYLFSDLLSHIR